MTVETLTEMGRRAKAAARQLARTSTEARNAALLAIADRLTSEEEEILSANALDVADGKAAGLSGALLDRLLLTPGRLTAMAADVRRVAELADPVGQVIESRTLENGLRISRRRTPIGVLGVIYEARPNVTVDVAVLALKTANAAILRGGKETVRSNLALMAAIHRALEETGLPVDGVQYVRDTDRGRILELLRLHEYVDMIIPRGGAGLHQFARQNATIPVITGGIGICHLYVDESADLDQAVRVVENAKISRPSVCNALDTVLVNRAVAAKFIPVLAERLAADGVEFRADPESLEIMRRGDGSGKVLPAGPEDFDTEWQSLVLGIKVVDGLDEAIEHTNTHSMGHSDGILTRNPDHAQRWVDEVDSSAVFVNASTRFNDGGQLGLGAEVAISTQKLHARGPMGLQELTTYKWVVEGDGHIRV